MRRRFVLRRISGSVRARAAVASVVIVGLAFALSAYGAITVLRHSLYSSATNTATAEALDLSSFITTRGRIPSRLPITADETAAQVVASNGAVLASSRDITGQPAMVSLRPAPGSVATRLRVVLHLRAASHVVLDLDYRFAVAAVGFRTASGIAGEVLVAESLGAADHAVDLVIFFLAVAFSALLAIVGVLVWIVTGWSLQPVELIRSEVAGLSASELHRRVPEPEVDDEIGRLARTMNRMLARLETSQARQRQLVADVSHELRNPLAALRAQLEVALEHPGPAAGSLLEGSILEVDRLSQLVQDLLTLARLDEGVLTLRTEDVDLDDLALLHAERLRLLGRVGVSVSGVSAARVRGDETQLTRAIANLADNAARHAATRVEFGVTTEGNEIVVSVADDGPGVPEADRERIFERFVRLDSARTHQGTGAGLGLAIVREIVEAHGGTVRVEDAHPGARFVVRLPTNASPANPPLAVRDAQPPGAAGRRVHAASWRPGS